MLEGRLGAPETAYPALVFYQLRRLWQAGRELHHAVRRRAGAPAGGARAARAPRASTIAASSAAARRPRARWPRRWRRGRRRVRRWQRSRPSARALTRFWHYFKRRALERRIAAGARRARRREHLARAGAARPGGHRARAAAGVSGTVGRGAPRDQSRGDRLRRGAVPAARRTEDPAGVARARGDSAARGVGGLRAAQGVRAADGADRARPDADRRACRPGGGDQARAATAEARGALSRTERQHPAGGFVNVWRRATCWRWVRSARRPHGCRTCSPRTPGTCSGSCCAS